MFDKAHIKHLAALAKLEVTDADSARYAEQISAILTYFKQLEELDTDAVPPTDHITGLEDVTRDDKLWALASDEELLAAVPEVEKRHVKVRAVFE